MGSMESFKNRNKFLVHLLIATGNWYLDLDGLIASPIRRRLLKFYAVLQDVWFVISVGSIFAYTVTGGEKSRQKLMKNLFVHIGALQYLSCWLFFVNRRECFRRFIQLWDDSFKNDPFPMDDRQRFDKEQSKNKIIFFGLILSMVLTIFTYFPTFFSWQNRDTNGKRPLPLKALFPFDTNKSPAFEMIIVLQMGMGLAWTCKIVGFAMVYYCLICQQTAKMKHLADRLAKLFDPEPLETQMISSSSEPDEESVEVQPPTIKLRNVGRRSIPEMRMDLPVGRRQHCPRRALTMENPSLRLVKERLRLWVQHHQQAIRAAKEMNSLLSRVLMEKILLVPLLLCYVVYIMFNEESDLKGVQFLSAVLFIIFCIGELLVFCRYGDGLEAAHGLLGNATLTPKWIEMRALPVIGSSLKIVEMGIKIPMTVKAFGFFPVSSTMFVDILARAYTGLMVLIELQRR